MSADQDLIDKAYDIVKARIERKEGTGADRAVLDILGTSAFRIVHGSTWNGDTIEGALRAQLRVAQSVIGCDEHPAVCSYCDAPFGLYYECDNADCVGDVDDESFIVVAREPAQTPPWPVALATRRE